MVSILISTYNWEQALELCLKSILRQSVLPDQVVIADDGSTEATRLVVEAYACTAPFDVCHVWHQDNGFRLSEIRNKAIAKCTGDYLIQIDGDVILHRHFIKDHLAIQKRGYFVTGSRASMDKSLSDKLLSNQSIDVTWRDKSLEKWHYGVRFPLLSRCFRNHKAKSCHHGVGCNMAFYVADLMAVNGYDENFQGWGGEDHNIMYRLMTLGIKKRTLKFGGIQFHINHRERYNCDNHIANDILFQEAVKQQTTFCTNGIIKNKNDE